MDGEKILTQLLLLKIVLVKEWPETLVNEAERLSIIGIELKKILLIASSFLIIAAAVPRPYMCVKNQLKGSPLKINKT